jgi:predicted unusual protein kinase regulating ubiquinone biosynthesis (AarF/ABC1/UbiB family)
MSPQTQRAIENGISHWKEKSNGRPPIRTISIQTEEAPRDRSEEILTSIPRRMFNPQIADQIYLPLVELPPFRTNIFRAAGRLFVWVSMIASFLFGTAADRVMRRDSEARRAVRLRRIVEKAGGTIIKFGQQMSMRIDFLPWVYTVELSKMLDQVPAFPLEEAIEVIERTTGKKWQDIFAVFDPEPIGSASVANVYQAILKNGDKVAVKVRRPGIGELFMADFKVLGWLLDLAEFLTILRPGYTQNLRKEFQTTLLEELDFIQEARYQDMFRRSAKKTGKRFFTAPRIYFEFSNQEVIVQEFTSGIWLWEIMAGVEQKNPEALRLMRELNIDTKKVAQRLLWVNYWGMQENLIFHADPHPANVIVSRNSKLTFIDFGSCGSFNRDQRNGLELVAVSSAQNDAEGMARGTLKLFEPLPPLDVNDVFQEVEAEFTRVLTIFRSRNRYSEWWERTSVLQWMSFFKYSREHNIPVALHTLRMIRATLLYDTVAVRIHNDIDRFAEYLRFKKFREQQAKKRVTKMVRRQFKRGLDDAVFLRLEEVANVTDKMMYRLQNALGSPLFTFSSLVGKWVFVGSMVIKLIGRIFMYSLIAALVLTGIYKLNGLTTDLLENLLVTARYPGFQVFIGLVIIINIRNILYRLRDQEI